MFVGACCDLLPEFAEMNTAERLCLLMSDDTPPMFDKVLYIYLFELSPSRESRLGTLAAQEKGS